MARIARMHAHRGKWARRQDIACWRVYDREIPDQPATVDWYDGDAVVWIYDRARNETPEQERAWIGALCRSVAEALAIPEGRVWLKQRRRQKDRQEGDGQYHRLDLRQAVKTVVEQGLRFEVNLSDYLDTGLFLDHRPTRALVRATAAGKDVLNLFAYTGAFTCYAAVGGARSTTTVDLSNTYLEWAGRNLALNGIAVGEQHRLERAEVLAWLGEPRAPAWDLIVCDPPTFSNSTAMRQSFSIVRDHGWLLDRCVRLLRPGGVLHFSTNARGFTLDQPPAGVTIEAQGTRSIPMDCEVRPPHAAWRMVR